MRFSPGVFVATLLAVRVLAQSPVPPVPSPATSQVSFEDFLAGLRAEAATKGISAGTIDAALTQIELLPVAVERDRTQPEHVVSLDTYVSRLLTKKVVANARAAESENDALLARVERRFGVPKELIVAVWGIESNFGGFTGTRPTIQTLATLAFDGRRTLFRNELFDALRIIDAGRIGLDQMKGSWAGAMGQPQFMPSSYLKYAIDFDEDGTADIWTTPADVFGSIANYLKEYGWADDTKWGREVKVSKAARARIERATTMRKGACRAEREMTEARPLSEWSKLGVTLPSGGRLPKADVSASLVRGDKRAFLVYRNYDAILGYNCSNSYAVSIGLLADQIAR